MFSLYHLRKKNFLSKRDVKDETLNGIKNEKLMLEKFKMEVAEEISFLDKENKEKQ